MVLTVDIVGVHPHEIRDALREVKGGIVISVNEDPIVGESPFVIRKEGEGLVCLLENKASLVRIVMNVHILGERKHFSHVRGRNTASKHLLSALYFGASLIILALTTKMIGPGHLP